MNLAHEQNPARSLGESAIQVFIVSLLGLAIMGLSGPSLIGIGMTWRSLWFGFGSFVVFGILMEVVCRIESRHPKYELGIGWFAANVVSSIFLVGSFMIPYFLYSKP